MESRTRAAFRAGYEAFNRKDAEPILRSLGDGVEYRMPLDPMRRSPSFHGPAGAREFYELLWDNFCEFTADVASINQVGDAVVVVGTFLIRRAPTDDLVTAAFAHFWTMRDGKVNNVSFHDAVNPLDLLERWPVSARSAELAPSVEGSRHMEEKRERAEEAVPARRWSRQMRG